ncbi:MAG: hypothetical protein DRJ42_23190 [Deltaproteobacteria bacterium]|nr:MAG: hypothetical protein DRJ42_23190 [Deltaproteobacteria bacterium]
MARSSTKRQIKGNDLSVLVHELGSLVAKNRKAAERLIAEIRKRQARFPEDFYRIGVALKALSQPALYGAVDHKSFKDLLRARGLVSPTRAYKLISVVAHYPEAQANDLGCEKAYAIIRYVAATPGEDLASDLVTENPIIGILPLDRMSVRQLDAATARVHRRTARRTAAPEAKAARRAARDLQRRLRAAGAKSAKVEALRVAGKWRVRTDLTVEDAEGWG